jgi:hypothetical protein
VKKEGWVTTNQALIGKVSLPACMARNSGPAHIFFNEYPILQITIGGVQSSNMSGVKKQGNAILQVSGNSPLFKFDTTHFLMNMTPSSSTRILRREKIRKSNAICTKVHVPEYAQATT